MNHFNISLPFCFCIFHCLYLKTLQVKDLNLSTSFLHAITIKINKYNNEGANSDKNLYYTYISKLNSARAYSLAQRPGGIGWTPMTIPLNSLMSQYETTTSKQNR